MSTPINGTSLGNITIVTGSFLLLFVLIKIFVWEQLTGVFKAREEKIPNGIDGAEAAREKAEALAAKRQEKLADARTEATQVIDDAKEAGKNREAKVVVEAREEVNHLKAKANQDTEQSKAEALSSVESDAADLTVFSIEKIMITNLDKEAQSNLIDSYPDKLGDA